MKLSLLLLLSLVGLVVGQTIISKPVEANDVSHDQGSLQETHDTNDKKIDKRSYGWSPWIWPSYSVGHGWPSYGHGWYGHGHGWGHGLHGWSIGWPLYYGHGWHGGHHGWHGGHGWPSKW